MKNKSGFTIVELLIVIVVIAILASITIVAFNGVQDRARNTSMTSGVHQYAKALIKYGVINGQYPVSALSCFDGTVNCWPSANQTASTALYNALKPMIPNLPLALPYTLLLQYASGSHYILFQVNGTECPKISGTTFMYATAATDTLTNCRVALPIPG